MTRHKTPSFWYDTKSPRAKATANALACAGAVYTIGHLLHQALGGKPYRAAMPVLCLGNLVAGGGGKTPSALAVMEMVKKDGLAKNPCFLSRGYGGALRGPILVDAAIHKASDVGDEPLLLARLAPVIIAADRAAGARLAEQAGYDFIIMDDGLQNQKLHRDISIIVIDGSSGFGNEMMLPAGPLRTPIPRGMKQADAVLLIGEDTQNVLRHVPDSVPILRGEIHPAPPPHPAPRYHAFCGIARPKKFYESLRQSRLNVTGFTDYPDHHPYTESDINDLKNKAKADDARLITTAKDAMRLTPDFIAGDAFDILDITLLLQKDSALRLRSLIETVKRA